MKSALSRFFVVIALLAVVNLLSSFLFFRLDLTEEKRYTLSDATKNLLANLDDDIHVNVYLTGSLPPAFKRLENSVRETLEEFGARAGQDVTYRFIDPAGIPGEEKRVAFQKELIQKGLMPANLVASENGQTTEQLVYPWAVVSYKGRELPVLLLKGNRSGSREEQLNQSIEGIEYELASAIRRLTVKQKKLLGVTVTYTSIDPIRLSDLLATLQQNYEIKLIDLPASRDLTGLDGLMVAKPDRPFSEEDKYKIDQFVVNGGRALFFVDGVRIDSIGLEGTYAQPMALNLDDLFFRWGIRLQKNLVKDLNSALIPLNVGTLGDKPNIQMLPWRFFPLINNFGGKSPIVRNLDAVYARFASTLDTARTPGIAKTPLLLTSPYTQLLNAPVLVSYNEARRQPDPQTYKAGSQMIACLLEGRFRSLYANRILPGDPRAASFKTENQPSRIVVCADGDLLVNDVNYRTNAPYPLGYDRFSRNTFANKDFVVNAVDYLLDDNGVIAARNRQITLRPLDKIRVKEERTSWQLLNLLGPLALLGAAGFVWQWNRRRFAT